MSDIRNPLISRQFLRSVWAHEYETFKDSPKETQLLARLKRWANRPKQSEKTAQSALLTEFFHDTWEYVQAGQPGSDNGYSLYPEFPVAGAGQTGGTGKADAALGWFTTSRSSLIPQVLVEFKDIKSALDAPQKRKGNARSPVKQGLDYLYAARKGMFGYEPIIPTWAIVTDMNEFRLYWADRGERQYVSLAIEKKELFQTATLLDETETGRFDRFLFSRLFHRDTLIVQGTSGRAELLSLLQRQRFRQRELENSFYAEYSAFREHLYRTLLIHNGPATDRFPGTKGQLVRLAQKILDRALFVFFCEDMGRVLGFPPQLLRDYLIKEADDPFFDPQGDDIWRWLHRLFTAMNDGSAFGGHKINQFNGGLFATDPELDRLFIPNAVFCERGQGQNEASIASNKRTLLYLSATYNYASGLTDGCSGDRTFAGKRDPERSIGLYTLGRIFEQSITELEILEAEEDGRASLNKENKRKRDGVYYTPEWVVERVVDETVGRRLADLKSTCGWPSEKQNQLPSLAAIDSYEQQLRNILIVDPACGSGAFLITTLAYLLNEWEILQDLRRQHGQINVRDDWNDAAIRDILRRNLYGVDINPASVEITKLALWLHTARSNKPLSSLDDHIRDGNSLIGPDFHRDTLALYSAEEKERVNAFDWHAAFPEVFARGGFDCVVGNPPYVKLQNFRKIHADMADYLTRDPAQGGAYRSTQTGNFDLYLPFIEKGIGLLNADGRLGYIAPSVWQMNEYGAGLRGFVEQGRFLWGWIDFGSYQVFEEATVYTALQFFSKRPNQAVSVIQAPDGVVAESPWDAEDISLPYDDLLFGDRWLLVTGAERRLIDKLMKTGRRLDSPAVTRNIFVGIQTSADHIYHLRRLGPNRYEEKPPKGAKEGRVVAIEEAIMKPLVSGPETSRYLTPQTETYLLFPYAVSEGQGTLIPAATMKARFPNAWKYLKEHEKELRGREKGKMDIENGWWGYVYPKNLGRQEVPKLLVPRLVTHMTCSIDPDGQFYLDNVDVGGVEMTHSISPWFLAAILNGKATDFVFRRISKPFRGDFRSANKQFIAPLPVPKVRPQEQAALARDAERLQSLHDQRRKAFSDIAKRLGTLRIRPRTEEWLFHDLPASDPLAEAAPSRRKGAARNEQVKENRSRALENHYATLEKHLKPGVSLNAELIDGELRFLIDGIPVINGIFPPPEQASFLLAQWAVLASRINVTVKTTGKKLADFLRAVSPEAEPHLKNEIIALQQKASKIELEIRELETRTNNLIYRLHKLTEREIKMLESESQDKDRKTFNSTSLVEAK
ncbi:Eco57I restriction-modification methylase domain-containing protein [Acetobacter sp.]|uniref:Eco57I restriction-modification methylase domain-containing protein n=1 Tax=Acetobacter sp. TaxID=440 RepID=UPI0039EB7294